MSEESRSRAWMLGPKAENEAEFERLLLSAFRDYCHWRRNFHPQDQSWVRSADRVSVDYRDQLEVLQDRLFEMVSHLKLSVPVFSARYLGHMITDLLMPGLLGYMTGMLYNQNNIVQEAAPVTQRLESEAMRTVAGMLQLPEESAWGHLCSGGSAANTEALWVARQIAFFPYQVGLALHALGEHWQVADNLEVSNGRQIRDIRAQRSWRHLSIRDTIALSVAIEDCSAQEPALAQAMNQHSVVSLGLGRFYSLAREVFGEEFPDAFKVVLSRNAHYSLKKSAGILGLAGADLLKIDLDESFRMRVASVRDAVLQASKRNEKVLAVVGVFGSTEEGAIDDFDRLASDRDEFRQQGLGDYWIHADACYGGYALSIALPDLDTASIRNLFTNILGSTQVPSTIEDLGWTEERIANWLRSSVALGRTDSISLDPHKLGYIPYPCGAIFFGDYRVRELVRCDAPYLNAATEPEGPITTEKIWEQDYLGRYTLEGSRPGAYGAAVWLAHTTVPLDQSGHGWIIAESMLGAGVLKTVLERDLRQEDGGDWLECNVLGEELDLNILCYTFPAKIAGRRMSLAQMNRCVERLYQSCLPTEDSPTHTKDFVIATTALPADEYGDMLRQQVEAMDVRGRLLSAEAFSEAGNPWRDATELKVVRSVIMGPFLLHAATRKHVAGDRELLLDEYVAFLRRRLAELYEEVLREPLFEERSKRPKAGGKLLLLEDDARTRDDLEQALVGDYGFRSGDGRWLFPFSSRESAETNLQREEFSALLLDINLGGNDAQGGLDLLEAATESLTVRGAVVFTGEKLQDDIASRIEKIREMRRDWILTTRSKPTRLGEGSAFGFGRAVNRICEDLWDIFQRVGS